MMGAGRLHRSRPGAIVVTPAPEPADADLLAGLVMRDERAAIAFVHRFQDQVFGLALAIAGHPGLAEDVSREVFRRAWHGAAVYDQRRGSVLTWLLTLTRNIALEAVRHQPLEPHDRVRLEALIDATLTPRSEDEHGHREAADAAAELQALHSEEARAVVLAIIAGLSARQVAEYERVGLGEARIRIRAGLRHLRRWRESDVD